MNLSKAIRDNSFTLQPPEVVMPVEANKSFTKKFKRNSGKQDIHRRLSKALMYF